MAVTIAIVGPTATGKSALGLELAERFEAEIVSADAIQAYRGFDIGTAKPSAAERARVRHHLVDMLDPAIPYSAGEFARRARASIAEIHARGRAALVIGGSGLYLRALFDGIAALPPTDPNLRRGLARRLELEGLPALHGELARRDPATAARLAPGDTQRVLRALEVVLATGVPLSTWLERETRSRERAIPVHRIGLTLERAVLYDRIAVRVRTMIAGGWLEEVRGLLDSGIATSAPAFQAIGYRELAEHLGGSSTLEHAVERTITATRRYAKRQVTWFRREADISWIDARDRAGARSKLEWFLSNAI